MDVVFEEEEEDDDEKNAYPADCKLLVASCTTFIETIPDELNSNSSSHDCCIGDWPDDDTTADDDDSTDCWGVLFFGLL